MIWLNNIEDNCYVFWTNSSSALRWSADLERDFYICLQAADQRCHVFLLIIFIISMILNIFIILQEFDLPLPIVKNKATKGKKMLFFFILIFLPSLLTTLSCDCYTFCGCNFVGLVTPKTMAEVQSLERLPMTLIPGPLVQL